MNEEKFGDSYDIVKRSLLEWLSDLGEWAAHPMLTQQPKDDSSFLRRYTDFLRVLHPPPEKLRDPWDRNSLLDWAEQCRDYHLFLDPDTGLMLPSGRATEKHLKADDLVTIAEKRPGKLTLVFDQSINRNRPVRDQVKEKLLFLLLRKERIHGITYESHACFVLVSTSQQVLVEAEQKLTENSRIPACRLVRSWDIKDKTS